MKGEGREELLPDPLCGERPGDMDDPGDAEGL